MRHKHIRANGEEYDHEHPNSFIFDLTEDATPRIVHDHKYEPPLEVAHAPIHS